MCAKVMLEELQEDFRKVTVEKLKIGTLVETVLSVDEGLVFKNGRTEKPKKIIIIGQD